LSEAGRLLVEFDDPGTQELYVKLYEGFRVKNPVGPIGQLEFLRGAAAKVAGEDNADELLGMWLAIEEAAKYGEQVFFGPLFLNCGVMHRWLTRPFVPFPGELTDEEKGYYRRFIFEAGSEEEADDLADGSGSRLYSGWSAKLLVSRSADHIEAKINEARRCLSRVKLEQSSELGRHYELLDLRLELLLCMVVNSRNAVSYQAQLDRLKGLALQPEANPALGTQAGWDCQLMLQTARKEIDNTARLIELLEATSERVLYLAASQEEEDIKVLGPDVIDQLRKKIDIMNDHWQDYDRLFTKAGINAALRGTNGRMKQ